MPTAHDTTHARVDDQLCFALYAASRAVTGAYRSKLGELGLTYPQYLTMLAVWEGDGRSVSEIGHALDLDSGTLSPLLRRLEAQGLVERIRSAADERTVHIRSTAAGWALEAEVAPVRAAVEHSTGLTEADFQALRGMLHRLRATIADRADEHPVAS